MPVNTPVTAEAVDQIITSVMEDTRTPILIAELNDVGSGGRSHYATGTYTSGCRGPLCTLAMQHKYAHKKFLKEQAAGIIRPADVSESTDVVLTVFASRLLAEQNRDLPDYLIYMMLEINLWPAPSSPLSPGEKLFYRTIETDFLYAKWVHLLANKERIWPVDPAYPNDL
jgi:hypothetical protein